MNQQLANYVRGKFIEILIVGFVTFVVFSPARPELRRLVGVVVGVSVLIPFVGAAVVTIPVALAGLMQFGWSWELAWIMLAYGVIQALDGNVLVPLLFSEAVDLHPNHHHRRRVGIRRAVGRLGRVLRHTAGYPAESHPQRLATGAASGLRALRPVRPSPD